MKCKAFTVLALVDSVGFSPRRAADFCFVLDGELTHEAPPGVFSGVLKSYRFSDGSVVNIDARGCSALSPEEVLLASEVS